MVAIINRRLTLFVLCLENKKVYRLSDDFVSRRIYLAR